MGSLFAQLWNGRRDLALVSGMIAILMILFVPIPPSLLDVLLILNLSAGLLILLLTFFTDTPLSFSTFPSLLLMTTLFRLALNISATRLILGDGNAGQVIHAIGTYVVGGNYVIGLVVFLILVVVQYVVVTSGAQRVAEVAARFTLDSMPGKQMSIDADLNMGLIDQVEAKRRRAHIEKEANFYGAMDGATKFVKGDAIAGILIILIDVIGGLSVGMLQHGLSWGSAVHRYTLLTVGDGIVTQIPSLVIAVATGIIITRAASDAQLGTEVSRQVLSNPRTLMIVALALGALLVLPGLPAVPIAMVLTLVVALAFVAHRNSQRKAGESGDTPAQAAPPRGGEDELYASLPVEPVEIRLGRAIAEIYATRGMTLVDRVDAMRRQFASDTGFVVPRIRVSTDRPLDAGSYEILVHGVRAAQGEIQVDHVLAINPGGKRVNLEGTATRDPAYGLPAIWIRADQRQLARGAGYTLVDPETVLMTHLSEIVKRHAPELLTRAETERLVAKVRERQATLVEELVPTLLSLTDIQKVLQLLLREQVSIRRLDAILEVLVDAGKASKQAEDLAERVRERLGASICQRVVTDKGELHVLTLGVELERTMLVALRQREGHGVLMSDPGQIESLISQLARQAEAMLGRNLQPVLLCPGLLRRHIRALIQRALPHVTVLGINEIPPTTIVRSFAAVGAAVAA